MTHITTAHTARGTKAEGPPPAFPQKKQSTHSLRFPPRANNYNLKFKCCYAPDEEDVGGLLDGTAKPPPLAGPFLAWAGTLLERDLELDEEPADFTWKGTNAKRVFPHVAALYDQGIKFKFEKRAPEQ